MSEVLCFLAGVGLAFAIACTRTAKGKQKEPRRKSRKESARDAFYMQNFLSYDGGEQEDFRE